MPCLPADALPAAEYLVRHLYRPIDVSAGSRYCAIAETAAASDDLWFWNDDNAKVLELMSRPEVWRRFPRETGEILRFVQSMCRRPGATAISAAWCNRSRCPLQTAWRFGPPTGTGTLRRRPR